MEEGYVKVGVTLSMPVSAAEALKASLVVLQRYGAHIESVHTLASIEDMVPEPLPEPEPREPEPTLPPSRVICEACGHGRCEACEDAVDPFTGDIVRCRHHEEDADDGVE